MNRTTPNLLARTCLGAFVALLAAGVVAPGKAQAGCSSHVRGASHSGLGVPAQLELLTSLGAVADASEASNPARPTPDRPCTGPSCSGRTAIPSTPTVLERAPVPLWGCLSSTRPDDRPGSLPFQARSDLDRPSPAPLAIFHPPRAS